MRPRRARRGTLSKTLSGLFRDQALLLAHQADDQAETILKRVLEGAHFLALGGMQKQSTLFGMRALRPLLEIPPKNRWRPGLKKGEKGASDLTNADPAFLRARLRTQILPELARQFGKEISSNLLRLGKTFDRLSELVEVEEELTKHIAMPGKQRSLFLHLYQILKKVLF